MFEYIRLQRTMCYGTCSVYCVTVDKEGNVNYYGEMFVYKSGEHHWKISKKKVEQLNDLIDKFGFKSFIYESDSNFTLGHERYTGAHYFKVSYKAILKRLIQLDLCSINKYEELVDICSLENMEQLQSLTKREGYSIELIIPSKETYVPTEYIEFVKSNYERGIFHIRT